MPPTRARLSFPFASDEWRTWFNPHINVYRHGVMLEELLTVQRNAFLDLLRVTLSIFLAGDDAQARDIMRLNDLLAELTGRTDDYGEWPYFVAFFGVLLRMRRGDSNSTGTISRSIAPSSATLWR